MKNLSPARLIVLLILGLFLTLPGCRREVDIALPKLAGNPGNPRFNLIFTNETNVDLDLYVTDPNKETLYYRRRTASKSGGKLDVDCRCGSCPQGPNENIFWLLAPTSPRGKYEVWVNYYDNCTSPLQPASYTLRIIDDSRRSPIVATFTGSLTSDDSPHWIFDTATGRVSVK
ncbi:MAG: hypothetical protein H7319_00460 [Spirosoma sp.]|nr:hypothetical protein [Spirosoma sp.]